MNELTVVTIVCDSFILGRYEAPAMRETLSLLTHSPLHIATLRCTDKIGCIATRTTLACPSLDPDAIYTISRHETAASRLNPILLYVACGIAWRANLCAQEILFIRPRNCAVARGHLARS